MTIEDDEIAAQQRANRGGGDSGDVAQESRSRNTNDLRFSALLKWVWAFIGMVAVGFIFGGYNKLSLISDTLIVATTDIKNQNMQVAELKVEVRDLRTSQSSMQRQIDSLEGKTLRGFEEAQRGK